MDPELRNDGGERERPSTREELEDRAAVLAERESESPEETESEDGADCQLDNAQLNRKGFHTWRNRVRNNGPWFEEV